MKRIEALIPATLEGVNRVNFVQAEKEGKIVKFDPNPKYIAHIKELIDPGQNPEDRFMEQEALENIRKAMNRLPLKQRLVFILRDMQNLTVREVAKVMKCTQQAVKSNLYYARRNIREMIENKEGAL